LAILGVGLWAGAARADVSTERSASILVFPKVISDATRQTIIQISNTSNQLVRAHCFYVNAALTDPTQPQGPFNPPLWQETDFDITLTKQQPTHWVVSEGRLVNPFDPACSPTNFFCDQAGLDPGRIPPVVPDFRGELKCIEVDDSGAPLSGNHLKGEASLFTTNFGKSIAELKDGDIVIFPGDESKYNAIGILGTDNNGDGTLVLGGGQCAGDGAAKNAVCTSDDDCGDSAPCAIEYNACPQTWILNHAADGAPDLVLEDTFLDTHSSTPTEVDTELTVVPCTENFETQQQTTVTLQFITTNEFESQFSVSTSIVCWGNFPLSEVGATALTFAGHQLPDPQGTMYLQTRIRSAEGTPFGVIMVAEETHAPLESLLPVGPTEELLRLRLASRAAVNLHIEGQRATPDIITIPNDQLVP
jgi:hypothetical protein